MAPTGRIAVAWTLLASISLAAAANDGRDYETIRFYTTTSKPEELKAHAFSPDGRYLALSFEDNLGSTSGVSIVDLDRKRLISQIGNYSFFTLAFSSNSQRILGIGGYAGIQLIDINNERYRRLKDLPGLTGKIGLNIDEENGKLLISGVAREFNATIGDQVSLGDEIVAINEGETPTRYDDQREWNTIAGKPKEEALEIMSGKPGTWLQLRLLRRGSSEPIDVCVQRQWPSSYNRSFPPTSYSLARGVSSSGVYQFRSADTALLSSCVALRDLERYGQTAVSPNAKRFAFLAEVKDGQDFVLEVHSLVSGKIERSATLDTTNFQHMRFSRDSQRVLVGTRDTVEVFDVPSGEWQDPVVLTPPEEADKGRTVTRRIPLGLGFPGDLFTTTREVVYSKPAALTLFDVSPDGTLAVGSETGEIVLASLETKERVGLVGDNILGKKPELIEFSPTGQRLVAFAKGVLHVFELNGESANSQVQTGGEASAENTP